MQKPYRFLVGRVSTYAEEGGAYLRRRKIRGRPFARVWRSGEAVEAVALDSEAGIRLTAVADELTAALPRSR